jgi:hypothetical protein
VLTELEKLLPALRLVPELVKGSRPGPATAAAIAANPQPLAELGALQRILFQRAAALEARLPAAEPMPAADVVSRLERLERQGLQTEPQQIAATGGTARTDQQGTLAELVRRIEALETAVAEHQGNGEAVSKVVGSREVQPRYQGEGGPLRAEIALILEGEPGADGPAVLRALEASQPSRKLPSPRTVRWHLAALRGNGNGALPAGSHSAMECGGA